MLGNIGVPGLVIILLIVVLLFGAKKIPDIAEGIGKGLKKFKDTQKDLSETTKIDEKSESNS